MITRPSVLWPIQFQSHLASGLPALMAFQFCKCEVPGIASKALIYPWHSIFNGPTIERANRGGAETTFQIITLWPNHEPFKFTTRSTVVCVVCHLDVFTICSTCFDGILITIFVNFLDLRSLLYIFSHSITSRTIPLQQAESLGKCANSPRSPNPE